MGCFLAALPGARFLAPRVSLTRTTRLLTRPTAGRQSAGVRRDTGSWLFAEIAEANPAVYRINLEKFRGPRLGPEAGSQRRCNAPYYTARGLPWRRREEIVEDYFEIVAIAPSSHRFRSAATRCTTRPRGSRSSIEPNPKLALSAFNDVGMTPNHKHSEDSPHLLRSCRSRVNTSESRLRPDAISS